MARRLWCCFGSYVVMVYYLLAAEAGIASPNDESSFAVFLYAVSPWVDGVVIVVVPLQFERV